MTGIHPSLLAPLLLCTVVPFPVSERGWLGWVWPGTWKKFWGRKEDNGWVSNVWVGGAGIPDVGMSGMDKNCTPVEAPPTVGREVMVGTGIGLAGWPSRTTSPRPSSGDRWSSIILTRLGGGGVMSSMVITSLIILSGGLWCAFCWAVIRSSVELERGIPIGKNLRGVALNPAGGREREGLDGREWEEFAAAVSCGKNWGKVKWAVVGGVAIGSFFSNSKLMSGMKVWCVGEGGALLLVG